MPREEFEKLVAEEFPAAVPEEFRSKISNVAFLIEDAPSQEDRQREGLHDNETLLGLYKGIPHTARGDHYGMGATLPDTITLYQLPIEREAFDLMSIAQRDGASIANFQQEIMRAGRVMPPEAFVRQVIRDTIWHEVYHHFGADESAVRRRERERRSDIL